MNKKTTTLLVLAAVAGLASCGGNSSSSSEDKQTDSISESSKAGYSASSESIDQTVRVASISVSPFRSTLYLSEGSTRQFSAEVLPEDAENKAIIWSVSNTEIAEIDENGLLNAKGQGTVTVIATSDENPEVFGEATLNIKKDISQDSKIDHLMKPSFLAAYERSTATLDSVEEIAGISDPSTVNRSSFYKNEDGKADNYKIGNENPFVMRINGTVYGPDLREETIENPYLKVSLSVYNDQTKQFDAIPEASLSDFVVISEDKTSYQFSEDAAGKTFHIEVGADETMYADVDEYCTPISFDFDVVDGYNVYSVADLSLFDNRDNGAWDDYREAKGVAKKDIHGLVLHKDIGITSEDIPASYKYGQAEIDAYKELSDLADYASAKKITPEEALELLDGSLVDYTTVFGRHTKPEEDFHLEGNYFTIDTSAVKQVYAFNDSLTIGDSNFGHVKDEYAPTGLKGAEGSHAQLFGINCNSEDRGLGYGGSVKFSNLTIVGNGDRSSDDKYMGGLITIKVDASTFEASNVLTSKSFITFFSKIGNTFQVEDEVYSTQMHIDRCKNFDSYNSLIYLWGTQDNYITNSFMVGAGGAIVLLDEVNANDSTKSLHGTPTLECDNCFFQNLITGQEPWFVTQNASALVEIIKQFGMPDKWLGRNALAHGQHKNLLTTNADGTGLIDLIAIDIAGGNPLGNNLSDKGSMLQGHMHIDNEKVNEPFGVDMARMGAADPRKGQEVFEQEVAMAYMAGNSLPLYRAAALESGAQGVVVEAAGGYTGMLASEDFTNGVYLDFDGVSNLNQFPFYNGNDEIAYNARSENMDGLASGDYLATYLQPAAGLEYLGVLLGLH